MKFNEVINIVENSLTNYKQALYGDKINTYAIISVENPMGIQATKEENSKANKEFKNSMKSLGIQYSKQVGMYGNKEHSFMIYNITLDKAKEIAKKYEQQSFFFGKKENGKKVVEYWYKENKNDPYTLKEKKADRIKMIDNADDFYSKKKGFKYTIDLDEFR
jgi:hypothetical protein